MKKLAFVLLFTLQIINSGSAQDKPQFYAALSGGLVLPMALHELWHNTYMPQKAKLIYDMKPGFMAGARFGYAPKVLKQFLAVELEYIYSRTEFDIITTGGFTAFDSVISGFTQGMNNSSVSYQSVFLNFVARYPNGPVHPYIGVGPGFTLTNISFDEPDLFGESGEETAFSFQFLAGVEFDLTDNFSLGAGYKYFSSKPEITWANGTHSHYDPSANSYFLDVKFKFL